MHVSHLITHFTCKYKRSPPPGECGCTLILQHEGWKRSRCTGWRGQREGSEEEEVGEQSEGGEKRRR